MFDQKPPIGREEGRTIIVLCVIKESLTEIFGIDQWKFSREDGQKGQKTAFCYEAVILGIVCREGVASAISRRTDGGTILHTLYS